MGGVLTTSTFFRSLQIHVRGTPPESPSLLRSGHSVPNARVPTGTVRAFVTVSPEPVHGKLLGSSVNRHTALKVTSMEYTNETGQTEPSQPSRPGCLVSYPELWENAAKKKNRPQVRDQQRAPPEIRGGGGGGGIREVAALILVSPIGTLG